MVRAVVKDDSEIHDREPSQISASRGLFDSLFYGGNVVLRNRAAENVVNEFKLRAARQWLHFDLAIAVLAVASSLFFVAALHVGFAANGFTIWHFWRLQDNFRV